MKLVCCFCRRETVARSDQEVEPHVHATDRPRLARPEGQEHVAWLRERAGVTTHLRSWRHHAHWREREASAQQEVSASSFNHNIMPRSCDATIGKFNVILFRLVRTLNAAAAPDHRIFVVWLESFEDASKFPSGETSNCKAFPPSRHHVNTAFQPISCLPPPLVTPRSPRIEAVWAAWPLHQHQPCPPRHSRNRATRTSTSSSSTRCRVVYSAFTSSTTTHSRTGVRFPSELFNLMINVAVCRVRMAIPLVDGMVVSRRALGSLVRQTAINICRRRSFAGDKWVPSSPLFSFVSFESCLTCSSRSVSSRPTWDASWRSRKSWTHIDRRQPSPSSSQLSFIKSIMRRVKSKYMPYT